MGSVGAITPTDSCRRSPANCDHAFGAGGGGTRRPS